MHKIPEAFKEAIREKVRTLSASATAEFREDGAGTKISIQENGREVSQTFIADTLGEYVTSAAAAFVDGLLVGIQLCVAQSAAEPRDKRKP